MILLKLFLAFAHIGLFAFGGGYAVMSLIQRIIIAELNWLSFSEFLSIVAVSELTPGPIAVNAATYVGYKIAGVWGATVATLAVCLPSFVIIITIIRFLKKFDTNKWVKKVVKGLRPAVVALIAFAAFSIVVRGQAVADIRGIAIALVSLILLRSRKLDPIPVLLLAGVSGIVAYL